MVVLFLMPSAVFLPGEMLTAGLSSTRQRPPPPQYTPAQGRPAPLLATVFLGANDAALPDRQSRRQHVPVPEYRGNLRRIVQHVRTAGSGPPPCVVRRGRRGYLRCK